MTDNRPEETPEELGAGSTQDRNQRSTTRADLVLFGFLAGGAALVSLVLIWIMTVFRSGRH